MTQGGCFSGFGAIGDLEWGSHFCHLYQTQQDLVDTVVPFLAAGLENNELCLWEISEPLQTEQATRELAERVSGLPSKIERGQVRIVRHSEWYGATGMVDADAVLSGWLAAEQAAQVSGYAGVRVAGHPSSFSQGGDWRRFGEFAGRVNQTFSGRRIIALCSYDLGRLDAGDLLNLLEHHPFVFLCRGSQCELLGKMSTEAAQRAPVAPHAESSQRARDRAVELERLLREQELAGRTKDEFLAMLGHELRNALAPMTTALQLMRLRGYESREQEILDRQVSHVGRLVDDLLDLSRIARGQIELRK